MSENEHIIMPQEVEADLAEGRLQGEAAEPITPAVKQMEGEPTNSQTPEKPSKRLTTEKKIKLVAPGTKDAPKFRSERPEELRRFINRMEDLWQEAGVTSDELKKSMIGKYADQDSEEEWAAFRTMGKGYSWQEFKREIVENYPEAAAAERGTPARIRQVCAEAGRIRLGDTAALYQFRRGFMAEAVKLQKPPAAMANRELVELFIGCLSESLASAVLQFLGTTKVYNEKREEPTAIDGVVRRPEDRYDLSEVCKAAIQVSENSQGMFSLMGRDA